MKLYLNYEVSMRSREKNLGAHFKNGGIALWKDIVFTFRRNTHINQKLSVNYLDKIQEFLSYNIKLRSKYWFELDSIENMNETPLYLNMPPSTTVQKIESKKVNIITQGQENWRVTAILTILASGEKLSPLLIFKAKEGKQTEKKLQELGIVENKIVCVYWQENAWKSESIMLRWIEEIWKKYGRNSHFLLKMKNIVGSW